MTRARLAPTPVPVTMVARHGGSTGIGGSWDADRALEELYAAQWRPLVRLSVLLVGDQAVAEDVVQDSFVAMHGRWNRLRDPEKGLAYLRQSVVNRSRSVLRHRTVVRRHEEREAGLPPRADSGPDDHALAQERRRVVLEALDTLPRRQREVLVLRHYAELSEAEIAETLGISRGAVKSHASRAAASLRRLLDVPSSPGGAGGADRTDLTEEER